MVDGNILTRLGPDEYWVAYMNSSSERWHIYVDIADDEAQAYKPDEEAPSGYFVCKLDLTALGPMEKIYRRRKKLQFIHVLKTLHKTRRSDHKE